MGTHRTKVVVLGVFALAILGGAAAGMLAGRYMMRAPAIAPGTASLSEQLQLTSDQRQAIQKIWLTMQEESDASYRQAEALNQQRENDLMKLLTDDQRKEYEKIHGDYNDHYTQLDADRKLAFNRAVEETKQLLTPSQRQRYEVILANRLGHDASEHGSIPSDHSPRTASSTTSASGVANSLPSPQ
jgi:Spy/CpxP family protein refolding chaperone